MRVQNGADHAFGHAVHLIEDQAEAADRLAQQRDRHRRGRIDDRAQGLLPEIPESRNIEQIAHHDGRKVRAGDALVPDLPQDRGRVETAVEKDRRAHHLKGERADLPADVKKRHHDQHAVGGPGADAPGVHDRGRQDRAVAELDALGLSGRPAGVDQIDGVRGIGPCRRRPIRTRGENVLIALDSVEGRADDDEALDQARRAEAFGLTAEPLLEHQHGRGAIGDDLMQLGRRQPPVQRHRDRAGQLGGADRLEIFDAVLRQDRKPHAALEAAVCQRVRELSHACRELRESHVLAFERNRRLVRGTAQRCAR